MSRVGGGPVRTIPLVLLAAAGGSLSMSGLPGCATQKPPPKTVVAEPPPKAFRPPSVFTAGDRPITEPIASAQRFGAGGPVLLAQQRLTAPADRVEGVAPTALETAPGEIIPVQVRLRSADMTDALRVLLADHLGRDYVIDPKVTGQVTLDIEGEFTKLELLEILGGLGTIYGWFVEEREGVLFIRASDRFANAPEAPVLQAAPAVMSDAPAARVRRLRHVSADQVVTVLKELVSPGAKVLTAGRTIVLADSTRQIGRLSKLVSALDSPGFDGVEVWTYRLSWRRPEDAQRVLEQLATAGGVNAAADAAVAFIPVPNSQRLIVVAKDATLQPMIQELLRQVDHGVEGERRQRYVYRVQHYPQAALVKLISDFFAEKVETAVGAPAAATGGMVEPRVRLVADPQSDVLLIHATPTDYADILATLRAVDRPPQQVVIQSIIAEVRLTNALEFGVEYFLSGRSDLGILELTGSVPLVGTPTGGAFFVGGDGFAVIQALDRESDTRVLSQPKIVIADRSVGSIQVGGEVPTIKATQGAATQQAGSSDIRTEIEYRNTGVILTIEPLINESGEVTLKIKQEVTDALPTDIPNQPEFTTRTVDTTVIVPSGRTVLLGGIINEDKRTRADRIPLIGRIPVLGALFSNQADTTQRTELLLAITPTILNTPTDALSAANEFIRSVAGVRAALLESADALPTGSLHGVYEPAADAEPAGPDNDASAGPDVP